MSRDSGIVAVRKNATRFNIVDRDEMEILAVVYKGSKTDDEHEFCAKMLASAPDMFKLLRDYVADDPCAPNDPRYVRAEAILKEVRS